MSVCEVAVCESNSPDGGVCEDCVDKTMNSGVCLECANEECDIRFICDNCGIHPIVGYMGGEGSAFLCCSKCWAEVEALDPEERDYQAEQIHDLCSSCRVKSETLDGGYGLILERDSLITLCQDKHERIAILEMELNFAFSQMTDQQIIAFRDWDISNNKHLFQQQPNKGDSDSTNNNGDETQ
tara:strand:+ start:112 stop:660 length:549 start_codon:yes stop_codon:yes gene_type:complete